jgi:hypothetical protein
MKSETALVAMAAAWLEPPSLMYEDRSAGFSSSLSSWNAVVMPPNWALTAFRSGAPTQILLVSSQYTEGILGGAAGTTRRVLDLLVLKCFPQIQYTKIGTFGACDVGEDRLPSPEDGSHHGCGIIVYRLRCLI